MELHQALKQIINTDGQEILTQPRIVNILSDLQAYQSIPAAKYIMASLINEGYMQQLLQIGKWNTQSDRLASQFVQMTGFQQDMVLHIFQSVAYGLNWKRNFDVIKPSNNSPTPTLQSPNQSSKSNSNGLNLGYKDLLLKSDDFVSDYIEKCQEYLDSIIEVKGNWEKELGAKFRIHSLYEVYSNASYIRLNFEITGAIKAKVEYHVAFNVVLYKKGKIAQTTVGLINKNDTNKPFLVVTTDSISEQYFKRVSNIDKIVVYWEIL